MASSPEVTPPTSVSPSTIQTIPRAVQITAKQVQPNLRLYLQDEDQLQLVALGNFANVTLRFNLRYLMPDGQIIPWSILVTAVTPGVFNEFNQSTPEGYLLTASMNVVGNLLPGQWAWGNITVRRGVAGGFITYDEILSGYVTGNYSPSWPEWTPQRPTDGAGCLRSITGTLPGAGADILETVPVNRRWKLLSFRATLTASAVVANRQPLFSTKDNNNAVLTGFQSSINQTAGLAWNYTFGPWGFGVVQSLTEVAIPSLPEQILLAGYKINTSTAGLQAGDQWSAPQYAVLEWADLE